MNMPQQSNDPLWTMLMRVTAGLSGLVVGTIAVKAALSALRRW